MNDLIEKLKSHIHWEEGMDETMLFLYHSSKDLCKECDRQTDRVFNYYGRRYLL